MTNETDTSVPERHITISFSGQCRGNPGPGTYRATVLNTRTGAEKVVAGRDASTTGNRMELTAAVAGLNALRPGAFVRMLGPSDYVVRCFTEWLPAWREKGWRNASKKPVPNADLWRSLEMAVAACAKVEWGRR